LKVQRSKLIKNLNDGGIEHPRTATVEKYDINFNDKTNKWY
jgi:hypothetical protein